MAHNRPDKLLRSGVRRFFASRSRGSRGLGEALAAIANLQRPAVAVGGVPRFLATLSKHVRPKDLDVVVDGGSPEDLKSSFADSVVGQTKFGGLILNFQGWRVDLWPLSETWAFKNRLVKEASFPNLPLTTFLNIDAVAVELFPLRGRSRRVYEHGFFRAVESRTIEINLEVNPNPEACVRRALYLASLYKFAMGPKLLAFISRHEDRVDWSGLLPALYFEDSEELFQKWLRRIRGYRRGLMKQPIAAPAFRWNQEDLWTQELGENPFGMCGTMAPQ